MDEIIRRQKTFGANPPSLSGKSFSIEIDWDHLVWQLARRALSSKAKKATMGAGAIVVRPVETK